MKQDPHTIEISAYIDDTTRKKLCVFLLLFFFSKDVFFNPPQWGPPLRWQRDAFGHNLLGDQCAEYRRTCVIFFCWCLVMGAKSLNVVLTFENSFKRWLRAMGVEKVVSQGNEHGYLFKIIANVSKRNSEGFVAKNDSTGQPPHAK